MRYEFLKDLRDEDKTMLLVFRLINGWVKSIDTRVSSGWKRNAILRKLVLHGLLERSKGQPREKRLYRLTERGRKLADELHTGSIVA